MLRQPMMVTRRDVLKRLGVLGTTLAMPPALRAALAAENRPDLVLKLVAAPSSVSLRPGAKTSGLRYTGQVISGREDALRSSPGNLGPTLELRRGERVRIRFDNRIATPTVIHWHGMIVPAAADGHPHQAVPPGASYTVEFTVRNHAGTYLYHPHPYPLAGRQTYYGLSGLIIVREPSEREIGLPGLDHELQLVIQDRRIDRDNRLVFKRSMMDDMNGVLGDQVLVNGVDDATFKVSPRAYRLRIANVSNARIYKLAWSDDRPLRVIATGSGIFSRSDGVQERPYVTLFPFQRIELVEDFGERRGDAEIALLSRAYSGLGMMSMMGGMGGGGMTGGGGMMGGGMMGPSQGDELHIARFTVSPGPRTRAEVLALPTEAPRAKDGDRELRTQLAFRHMRGFLNDRRFNTADMTAVAEDEWLPVGVASVWTFENDGGGMPMPHPMHIHGVRFRVVERSGGAIPGDLRDGMIDVGFRDTVGVFPGERVRLRVAPVLPGLFMYHCHNLEHEDGGMMRNVRFSNA